jgi:imidazolonepropionase-like amidohydrolase
LTALPIASLLLAAALLGRPPVVLTNVTIYISPYEVPIQHGTVVITGSTITAVGRAADVPVPDSATVLACDRCVVMAGFWNTHVHFEEPLFSAQLPADTLSARMQAMLTRYGFTTVIDLGSNPNNTIPLRNRIAAGEVTGPRILSALSPLYPPHGIPFYLNGVVPADAIAYMEAHQTPSTRAAARALVDDDVHAGADVIKLFTGAWVAHGVVQPMPDSVAVAAVREAHRMHRLVFSHCSNLAGARVAIDAGVDVMAHTLDAIQGVDSSLFRTMVERHMSLIPTLSLFAGDPDIKTIVHEVTIFRSYGGELLFGTDVGFTHEYDTTHEYELLQQAGLSASEVLRMLTTGPTHTFSVQDETTGMVKAGAPADITVLAADPSVAGLAAFAHVRYTIRAGRVIFAGP